MRGREISLLLFPLGNSPFRPDMLLRSNSWHRWRTAVRVRHRGRRRSPTADTLADQFEKAVQIVW